MTSATDLKQIATGARRLIEQAIDVAEELAAFREAASAKGIDWSQLKALLKAQVLDERDGSDKRVSKLLEKAEFATAYADMLGIGSGRMNENDEIHSSSSEPTKVTITGGGQTVETDSATLQKAAAFVGTPEGRRAVREAAAAEGEDIPEFLRRAH